MAMSFASVFACESDEYEYNSTCYTTFDIDLVNGTSSFSFYITAKGTFYVDWGDGNGVQTITRASALSNLNNSSLVSSSSLGTKIRIFGLATEYSTSATIPVISFSAGTASAIAGISGSLGAIFPLISPGNATKYVPNFYQTFKNCSNLESAIPDNLFDGVGGTRDRMFEETFYGCSKLSGDIPSDLFRASGTATPYLFRNTFNGCSNLTGPVPDDLFSGVSGSMKSYMFYRTFYGCSKLGTDGNGNSIYFVSPTAFDYSGLSYNSMAISGIFTNTALLTACPAGAYTYHTGYEGGWTVSGSNKAVSCYWCPIGTYKPNTDTSGTESTIAACLSCAAGTYNDQTGQVACTDCAAGTYNSNTGSTSASACLACPVDTYNPDTGSTSALACLACPTNTTSPAGSTSVSDCVSQSSCPGGMPKYNGTCAVACNGLEYLKTNNVSIPVFGNKLTTHAIHVSYNGNDCYVPMESGSGTNTINMQHGNNQYHAIIVQ